MNTPNLMLKVIVLIHFILSVWATMGSWLPNTYIYVHVAIFICGLWAIASSESVDSIAMLLIVIAFSILQDIILLSLYEPRGHDAHERDNAPHSETNEYRFALGMCILNLILKPFTGFLLVRIYQARGNDTAFNIPGIDRIPGLGGMGGGSRGYEDIDNRPSSGPYTSVPVESAAPHETVDKE